MDLVCISDNSKYFLFCDNLLQTFSVWYHSDKSYEKVRDYLISASKHIKSNNESQEKKFGSFDLGKS